MLKPLLSCMMLGAALLLAPGARAAAAVSDTPVYNNIELQAETQREVQNDLLNAVLYAEMNDASAAALAGALNKAVNEALQIAKNYPKVRVRSGNNQTYPVYAKAGVLQGWRGRAEIRLESRDFEAAAALIGKLQATLQLGGLNFSVSPELRRSSENELIAEAIAAFKARADIVKGALAARGYRLQRLNINSGYNAPAPRMLMQARGAAMAAEVAAPSLEGGVSTVTVSASGIIEILE